MATYTLQLRIGHQSGNIGWWSIQESKSGSGTGAYKTASYTVTINGQTFSGTGTYDFRDWPADRTGEIVIATGTFTLRTGSNTGTASMTGENQASYTYNYDPTPPTPSIYTHTLTYSGSGWSSIPSKQTIENTDPSGFTATISSATPFKLGYTFRGWSESNDTSVVSYQPGETYTFDKPDVTLYVVWERTASIIVSKNLLTGGTVKIDNTQKAIYSFRTGTTHTLSVETNDNYYISGIYFVTLKGSTPILTTDTVGTFTKDFTVEEGGTFSVQFQYRETYHVEVDTDITVNGKGSYRYLDQVALLAIVEDYSFDGWYEGDIKLSSSNPYIFQMPNRNLILSLKSGGQIFTQDEVSQFAIKNGNGEMYMSPFGSKKIFFSDPDNLGVNINLETIRIGNSEIVDNAKPDMPQPNGTLIFYADSVAEQYKDFYDFARFINVKPLTLWYKIPARQENNIFHIPVELLVLEKPAYDPEYDVLKCPIRLYGTSFWQATNVQSATDENSITVYNDSDHEVGIDIIVQWNSGEEFDNPRIRFIQNNVEYGAIALAGYGATRIELDTRNKKQKLRIFGPGGQEAPDPYSYIDFSYADGVKDFPFPKLKQGYTKILFTHDYDDGEGKEYIIDYEKEYLIV